VDRGALGRADASRRHRAVRLTQPSPNSPSGLGTTASLAIEAGRQALDSAGARPEEISFLVLCTSTPDQLMPATSCTVAGALGITGGAITSTRPVPALPTE